MPLYFRKSIRLGGGMRINLSKSGIGFSAGTRGLRVSTGARGTYVNVGAGGISYRQKIGGPYGQSSPAPHPSQPPLYSPVGTAIPNADASQLLDSTSAATLERLNTTLKQPAYAWIFVTVGLVMGAVLGNIHPILFIMVFGFALYLAYLAHQMDIDRRTYPLEFHLDDSARQRWVAMCNAFAALSHAQMLWRITTQDHTYDWKRNAGATSLLNRVRAFVTQKSATYIASNFMPYCLDIGTQQLFFFPDRIYVYQGGTYGAVEYGGLILNTGQTHFIESDAVPSDGQAVGSTWQYVNKNGTPDRRFSSNRQLPIMNYGVLELKSATGLNVLLHVSSTNQTQQFANLYQKSFAAYSTSRSSHQQAQSQPPPSNGRQQYQSPPQPAPQTPNCYRILGLTPNCTKDQASAKYRELAQSYHPDRVNHLAPEFRALAHQKMTEINSAYVELKRLRGW